MSRLFSYRVSAPMRHLRTLADAPVIARALERRGVLFEQWSVPATLSTSVPSAVILNTLSGEIERIQRLGSYPAVDVVSLQPDPKDPTFEARARAARHKFLEEHTHAEDEVRFFVQGSGAFYLRWDDEIDVICCERGDLLSVPALTKHWFDMGAVPSFCAIRFLGTPEGWVADFTGDSISKRLPSLDDLREVA